MRLDRNLSGKPNPLREKAAASIARDNRSRRRVILASSSANPPAHGAEVVPLILADLTLRRDWKIELNGMRSAIDVRSRLAASDVGFDLGALERQEGFFALLAA
jgi:aspartate/tyrosine/aromatic aminotransferase